MFTKLKNNKIKHQKLNILDWVSKLITTYETLIRALRLKTLNCLKENLQTRSLK